jgi:hypothetical protein
MASRQKERIATDSPFNLSILSLPLVSNHLALTLLRYSVVTWLRHSVSKSCGEENAGGRAGHTSALNQTRPLRSNIQRSQSQKEFHRGLVSFESVGNAQGGVTGFCFLVMSLRLPASWAGKVVAIAGTFGIDRFRAAFSIREPATPSAGAGARASCAPAGGRHQR